MVSSWQKRRFDLMRPSEHSFSPATRRRRDRRGRGLRGRLVPIDAPLSRSRAEAFDDLVLDAVESLDPRWAAAIDQIEFAVEDVPRVEHTTGAELVLQPNVIEDGSVPLSRLIPGRRAGNGLTIAPRIVLYRRPLEIRGRSAADLSALIRDIVVEQIAALLGCDPEEIAGS